MENEMSCAVCGAEVYDDKYSAKNYPKNGKWISFCGRECMKKWLVKNEITFGIFFALCIALLVIIYHDNLAGIERKIEFYDIFEPMMFMFIPMMLRKVGLSFIKRSFDGFPEFLVFSIVVLLSSFTIIIPLIFIIKEVIQFVRLNKLLKETDTW